MPTPLNRSRSSNQQRAAKSKAAANSAGASGSARKKGVKKAANSNSYRWLDEELDDSGSSPYSLTEEEPSNSYEIQFRRPTADEGEDTDSAKLKEYSAVEEALLEKSRYAALQRELGAASQDWILKSKLPSKELLREGLLALNTGLELPPDQKALLLRTSLAYRSGVRTAIRHQDDAELASIILCEAITDPELDEPPAYLLELFAKAPDSADLKKALITELRATASGTEPRARMHAVSALWYLEHRCHPAADRPVTLVAHIPPTKQIVGFIVALAVTVLAAWYVFDITGRAVDGVLPSGTYTISSIDGQDKVVSVSRRVFDVHEVTNGEYRACVLHGKCTAPALTTLDGIENYYRDPAYDDYPVVYVSHAQASAYCEAKGMRLPTEEEWILAASAAPSTGVSLAYPWGNEAIPQRANTSESGINNPVEVGSYRPSGDSPIGVADLIGNAAEWTATLVDDGQGAIVKGGSFRDEMRASTVTDRAIIPLNVAADWIGFRCVDASK